MTDDRGPREALENLFALAWRDLGRHRLVARMWGWADRLLVAPAAVLAVGSAVVGLAGLVDRGVAAAAALVGAVLAGVSIAARLPERARRALNAVTYLRVMTSEVGIMLTSADPAHRSPDAVAELRRWYMRINAVIAAGADELHPDLLEFPPSPGTRPRRDLVG